MFVGHCDRAYAGGVVLSETTQPSQVTGTSAVRTFTVRRAMPADVQDMARVWQESVTMLGQADARYRLKPDALDIWCKMLLESLAQEYVAIFVAESSTMPGHILGYIVGAVIGNLPTLLPERFGFVSELAVDSHGKAGGIGRQLFDGLKGWFAERGITHVQALVPARQPVAQAFWRALGASELYDQMWLKLE